VGGEDALAVQLSACSGGARGYDDVQQPQTRLGLDSVKAVRHQYHRSANSTAAVHVYRRDQVQGVGNAIQRG
jgi:hypothetical protein